ncbi:MAG: M20/M25/M40 family metallo-hydrolase [Candidatus Helarchaeota archaeon]
MIELDEKKLHGFDKEFANETIKILQELIRIDTTNPPGNEIKAASWIQDYLSKDGIESEIIESAEGRGNIISRLKGTDSNAPSLMILSHLDVVPSQDLKKWEFPPFSGEFKDNFIWGRGALDCKGTTAPQLMTFITLYREGFKPKGDIIFAATADEEAGGHFGPGWLLENKFEKFKADYVITEGGGQLVPLPTKNPNYIIQVAEKGIYWTRLKINGAAGHGSVPGNPDKMAIVKMAKVIEKISKFKPKVEINDIYKQTLETIEASGLIKFFLGSKRLFHTAMKLGKIILKEDVSQLLSPLVQNKITVTMLNAGSKVNNIPGTCEASLDVRLLPGYDREHLNFLLRKIFGKKLFNEIEIEAIENQPGGYTPIDTEFGRKIEDVMKKIEPTARLIPYLSPGSTDMCHLRKYGIKAYGFVPMKVDEGLTIREMGEMPHGYNERISYGNLMFATRFFYELCSIN